MIQPTQFPVMIAHGVGFKWPSVPFDTASRTAWTGAANIRFANIAPKRGQRYWKMMISLESMALDFVDWVPFHKTNEK